MVSPAPVADNAPQPEGQVFTLFPKLLPEIRTMIWQHAIKAQPFTLAQILRDVPPAAAFASSHRPGTVVLYRGSNAPRIACYEALRVWQRIVLASMRLEVREDKEAHLPVRVLRGLPGPPNDLMIPLEMTIPGCDEWRELAMRYFRAMLQSCPRLTRVAFTYLDLERTVFFIGYGRGSISSLPRQTRHLTFMFLSKSRVLEVDEELWDNVAGRKALPYLETIIPINSTAASHPHCNLRPGAVPRMLEAVADVLEGRVEPDNELGWDEYVEGILVEGQHPQRSRNKLEVATKFIRSCIPGCNRDLDSA